VSFDICIREATVADLPEILRQRRGMYEDMDYTDDAALGRMISTSAEYLSRALADGTFRCWLASSSGAIVGGGAVLISPWPSHPYDGQCRRATILNVYTYPQHRRKGVARFIMQTMIAWCRSQDFSVIYLHASKDGRPLYQALGFVPTNEMRLKF
jgi:GNAT superfamily N-acetyltransferase